MTNIGLVTYVYEDYQDFIPLFVYSTLKNNPDIGIKIFLKEELTDYNRRTLEAVDTNKVQIIENYSIPCPIAPLHGIRYLIPEKDLSEFDYVYLSDVDLVNIEDMTKRCAQDIEASKKSLLPFNGSCYNGHFGGINDQLPRFQLGSVFIEVKPYYKKMSKTIEEVHSGIHKDYISTISHLPTVELLFYYMLDKTFQFDFELFNQNDDILRVQQLHGLNLRWLDITKGCWWKPDAAERLLLENIYEKGTEQSKQILRKTALPNWRIVKALSKA